MTRVVSEAPVNPLAMKGVNPMLILLIILIVLLAGSVPAWPYSRAWGYYPSGSLGTILLVVIILIVLGIVPLR
jgi:Protein of unknown function (DUF3309)